MNYTFDDYEAVLLWALHDLAAPVGYLKTLKGYAGELDEETALDNFLRGFPGVLVEVSEAVYSVQDIHFYEQVVTANLLVGARSFRSQDEARGGGTGAFTVLADLRRRLLGKTLGLEIQPLLLLREAKLASSPQTVIYLAEYRFTNNRIEEK